MNQLKLNFYFSPLLHEYSSNDPARSLVGSCAPQVALGASMRSTVCAGAR